METERLIIRRFQDSDLEDLYEYLSDYEVVKYEPYKPIEYSKMASRIEKMANDKAQYAVVCKEDNKVIGNIYLGESDFDSYELGYVFNKNYWHKGYAKEAASVLINALFSKGIHRIYAECDPENENSWRLLESLGFTREAYLKKNVYFWKDENGNPLWKDTFIYSKLNETE